MKDVNIYVKESCDALDSKDGNYIALLSTQGKELLITKSYHNTTNYRMIIQGAIDAVKMLNQPCTINLYTNTTFGMSRIRNSKGEWRENAKGDINTDLLDELKSLILKGGHEINNFYDKSVVDSNIFKKINESDDKMLAKEDNGNFVLIDFSDAEYNKILKKSIEYRVSLKNLIKSILKDWIKEND